MSKPIMSNHGFTRPGDGWLHGSCFGAKHYPYEISCDRIQPYIDTVKEYRQGKLDYIENLMTNPPEEVTVFLFAGEKDPKKFTRPENFDPKNVSGYASRYSSYEGEWKHRKNEAEWQVKKADREVVRMEKRLADWKPKQ